ncbi:hypothetical protein ABZ864_40715 [Streptomyces sp. NPDC047082]|uniref:hypothetical protein n=1 Tax=Streptomyces sp. NPDC047082 TaxID=3155259 RepID=UPI0033F3EB2F
MTSEQPARGSRRPRALPSSQSDRLVQDSIIQLLADQLGGGLQQAAAPQPAEAPRHGARRGPKLKGVHLEYGDDPRDVHDFAGGAGYSLASNWFTQLLAQLAVANSITKSELCVFLFVAGGQTAGTGIAEYTQQEITDGLNELAAKKENAKYITRPTVNRAVRALCEYNWIETVGNGRIRLNVKLWFRGSSVAQHNVLGDIAEAHADDNSAFPDRIGPALVHHQEALDLTLDEDSLESARKRRTG